MEKKEFKDKFKKRKKKLKSHYIYKDFAEVEIELKKNEFIKGKFSLLDGQFPGKVSTKFQLHSHFSMEFYFSNESLKKKKPDRTFISKNFSVKHRT